MGEKRDADKPEDKRVPSAEYRERRRHELFDDPEIKEEIEEFNRFLKERGVKR